MSDIQTRMNNLQLTPLFYTAKQTEHDGKRYWIPCDAIGLDRAILFRPACGDRRDLPGAPYNFDGWEPCCKGPIGLLISGGRYTTFEGALSWMESHLT